MLLDTSTLPPKMINILLSSFFSLLGQIFYIPMQILLQAYNFSLLIFIHFPLTCLCYREKLIRSFFKKMK